MYLKRGNKMKYEYDKIMDTIHIKVESGGFTISIHEKDGYLDIFRTESKSNIDPIEIRAIASNRIWLKA
jgi:hypothetical protein